MKLKRLFIGSLFLSAVLAGCSINDYGDCRSSEFTLSLDVRVPAVSADAATKAAGHDTEKGNDAESAIDDIRIIVFDKNGAYLDAVAPESVTVSEKNSDYTVYSLVGKLDPKKDENNLESFRVMVLANWTCFDGSNYNGFGETDAQSISEISGNGKDFNFTIKYKEEGSVKKTWTPSLSGNKTLIPMFGLSDNLKVDSFFADKDGVVRVDATISMLRALAKVEIVDATDDAISSVSLSSSNLNGRFIPAGIDGSAFNPDNIGSPSLPTTDIATVTDLSFVKDENNVWVAYIPEMAFDNASRPVFNMNIGSVPFDNYSNNTPTNTLDAVLRNHIYRYNVKAKSTSLEIELKVLPWDMEWDENPVNYDTPKVSEYISWVTQDNGYIDDTESKRLLMKPSIDEYVEATFTLDAPMYGKWVAYFRPTSGQTDAFYFTTGENVSDPAEGELHLVEGNNSGIIDGKPIKLRVACRYGVVNDENNEAILIIMVQYPDNSTVEVYVVDENSLKTNYTIVEQVTEVM